MKDKDLVSSIFNDLYETLYNLRKGIIDARIDCEKIRNWVYNAGNIS